MLRRRYPIPIVGMEPAVKLAFDLYGARKVLVTATPITINGDKIKRLIARLDRAKYVELLALPSLVDFAERQDGENPLLAGGHHELGLPVPVTEQVRDAEERAIEFEVVCHEGRLPRGVDYSLYESYHERTNEGRRVGALWGSAGLRTVLTRRCAKPRQPSR